MGKKKSSHFANSRIQFKNWSVTAQEKRRQAQKVKLRWWGQGHVHQNEKFAETNRHCNFLVYSEWQAIQWNDGWYWQTQEINQRFETIKDHVQEQS